jgi:hypothetical protein
MFLIIPYLSEAGSGAGAGVSCQSTIHRNKINLSKLFSNSDF